MPLRGRTHKLNPWLFLFISYRCCNGCGLLNESGLYCLSCFPLWEIFHWSDLNAQFEQAELSTKWMDCLLDRVE